MARRSRSKGKGPLWHGYRRPVRRDKVLWLAVGTSIAALFVQNAFGNFEATTRGWIILGLEVVATFGIVFALIGVLAGTLRGFGEGWRQADAVVASRTPAPTERPPEEPTVPAAEPPPAQVPEPDPVARLEPEPETVTAAGAEPEGAATLDEPDRTDEPDEPDEPGPLDRPKVGVDMERHARRLGRAIGAGRRTYKNL